MKRVMLTVAYDGTNYCGWQFQTNGVTIEEMLNKALTALLREPIQVIGASRTDSGVHARGNVAVFDTSSRIPADKICFALNQRLPEDIRIQKSEEVPLSFHPRKANCRKTYEYKILNRKVEMPLSRLTCYFCYFDLDVEKMKRAAACLVGEHDFKSFCTVRSQAEETVRTIYSLTVNRDEDDVITIRISGSGFLYNMVRIIAGTLVKVGRGAYPPGHMEEILEAGDRSFAGPTIPPEGLTLVSLEYEKELCPCIEGKNRHWHYTLDQRELVFGGPARLTVHFCEDAEFGGVVKRMVHQAYRNGANTILAHDASGRLRADGKYGYYRMKPADSAGEWMEAVYEGE